MKSLIVLAMKWMTLEMFDMNDNFKTGFPTRFISTNTSQSKKPNIKAMCFLKVLIILLLKIEMWWIFKKANFDFVYWVWPSNWIGYIIQLLQAVMGSMAFCTPEGGNGTRGEAELSNTYEKYFIKIKNHKNMFGLSLYLKLPYKIVEIFLHKLQRKVHFLTFFSILVHLNYALERCLF